MKQHETPNNGKTNEWYTPPEIITPLGCFDLDPCAAESRKLESVARHFTRIDDGFSRPWFGRVWLNPPYGKATSKWMERMAAHGFGIALIAARVETKWFQKWVWQRASGALFIAGRVKFLKPDGSRGKQPGFPSVLVAYGQSNLDALRASGIRGTVVNLRG